MLAEIITIGDEILIGQTVDTNSAWLGKKLNSIGIDVVQVTSIQDSADAIKTAIKLAEERADIILMTGGLGPTKDDITKNTLLDYFNTSMVQDDEALKNIKRIFNKRNIPILKINEDQALVPKNCLAILNTKGTAPGMYFEEHGKIYVSMPGVPYEMKAMMTNMVLPKFKNNNNTDVIVHETITVVNIPESILATQIEHVENSLPEHIKIAYLPHLNLVRMRLSARSKIKTTTELKAEIKIYFDQIKDIIGDSYFNGEQSLSKIIGKMLKEREMTIGTVESCSGGFVAHSITIESGSSAYYQGSLLTYSNQMKINKLGVDPNTIQTVGAVSPEVAKQMAKSAQKQLGVDFCISTTGIAGPSGATETKPVGLVYIGLAKPNGEIEIKKNIFTGDRAQVIERTATTALEMLRKSLVSEFSFQSAQKPEPQQ